MIRPAERFDVGLIGAGRLGQAFGRAFQSALGQDLAVWSRRFGSAEGPAGFGSRGLEACGLDQISRHEIIVAAIPNAALCEVTRSHSGLFAEFTGLVLLTGADAPPPELAANLANAATVRVVPMLLPGEDRIVSLALAPEAEAAQWAQGRACLEALGGLVVVENSAIYEEIMILTSPLAAVVRTALTQAITGFLDQRAAGPDAQGPALQAASLALTGQTGLLGEPEAAHEKTIATPGGLTEVGLDEAAQISEGLLTALRAMRRRADGLSESKPAGDQDAGD